MPGHPIPAAVLAELQRQMNHEFAAAHAYTALSLWCAEQNLKGLSRFFEKQSGEEREHAQKFADHLLDRGTRPELGALPAPKTEFASALEVASHARRMEQVNTEGIHQAYSVALREGDFPAQVRLQWFIAEQVEEEAWCDELVARMTAATTPGGLAQLDHHIERQLAQSRHVEGGGD
jgi:ferritin